MNIEIVAAVANKSVIGKNGQLPWRLNADMRRFRNLTIGHTIIMGRKTWEGLPGPLDQRQNIIVSKSMNRADLPDGVILASSFDDAISKSLMPPPAFAIGGTEIYREAMASAQRMHITQINCDFEGNVYFPEFSKIEWKEASRHFFKSTRKTPFSYEFVEYVRS